MYLSSFGYGDDDGVLKLSYAVMMMAAAVMTGRVLIPFPPLNAVLDVIEQPIRIVALLAAIRADETLCHYPVTSLTTSSLNESNICSIF